MTIYFKDGYWYYDTPDGEMMCPPFVRTKSEAAAFLGIEPEVTDRPDLPFKIKRGPISRIGQYDRQGHLLTVYESITDAAEKNRLLRTSISACLNGRTRTAGGYKWRKVN